MYVGEIPCLPVCDYPVCMIMVGEIRDHEQVEVPVSDLVQAVDDDPSSGANLQESWKMIIKEGLEACLIPLYSLSNVRDDEIGTLEVVE